MDALPEEFRTVFVLREVEGLSTAETAACLVIRPETVKTRLHRARRLLQERLTGEMLGLSPSLFEFEGQRCDRIVGRVQGRLRSPPAAVTAGEPRNPVIQAGPSEPRLLYWLARRAAFLRRRRKR